MNQRPTREGNLVDAIESIAYPMAEALGGTYMIASTVSTSTGGLGISKEGNANPRGFGGPERGG